MYYYKSSTFISDYGDVYESPDRGSVALILYPSDDTDNMIVISFVSYSEVSSTVYGSRSKNRNAMADDFFNFSKQVPKELLQELKKSRKDESIYLYP